MLQEEQQFVSMREKIAQAPRTKRLLGAAHVYLWGKNLVPQRNIRDWRGLAKALGVAF